MDRTDVDDAERAISDLCQTWGGACHLLAAVDQGIESPTPEIEQLAFQAGANQLAPRGLLNEDSEGERHELMVSPSDTCLGEPLLPVMVDARIDNWRPVRVPVVDADDPWRIAYLGALGTLPERPLSPQLLQLFNLREDLKWDDVIETTFDDAEPGPRDLLERLRDPQANPPTTTSLALLTMSTAARHSGIATGPSPLPRDERPALVGPNIVVVYEPDSVRDLCLLWNLRAAHGLPRGLPLAAPHDEDLAEVLQTWQEQYAQSLFGLGGDRRPCVTSLSVRMNRLDAVIAGLENWRTLAPEVLMQVVPSPSRTGTDLATFNGGSARIAGWSPEDRNQLGRRQSPARQLDLTCNVSLQVRVIPPIRVLRPKWSHEPGIRGGGYETRAGKPDDLVGVEWPSGWEVLAAAAADRGLRAYPSRAGRAAAAFLVRLGALRELELLLDANVIHTLYRLGQRRGMSWFRDRVRELAEEVAGDSQQDHLDRIEARLAEMSLRPFEEEQPELVIEEARRLFANDRTAASAWLRWAESAGILVRGVRIECDQCDAPSWRTTAELGPPISCRGCGQVIGHPFPEGELKFRYRASEPLLRIVDDDALPHLLAMRWWTSLFYEAFNRPATLYGAYPGVDLHDARSNEQVGEADVLLLFADGSLVPGECKRHGTGLNEQELAKLDRLVDRLEAPWSFLATPDWADRCPAVWREAVRYAPEPMVRVALTAEHLLDPVPYWPGGVNIFEPDPANESEQASRHARFVGSLPNWLANGRGG